MKFLLVFLFPLFGMAGEINVNVKGMVCGFCAQGIEKKLKSDPSVKSVKIDLETKNVNVVMKDESDISNDDLKKILQDSGFNIEDGNISRTPADSAKKKDAK